MRDASTQQPECEHPTCSRPAVPDAPTPLCWKHLNRAFEFVTDLLAHAAEQRGEQFRTWEAEAEQHWLDVQADVQEHAEAAHAATAACPSVVYYLRFGDRVKIGTTRNLRLRLASLPHDDLLATEPGDYHVEHQRHVQFRAARIKGEWFHAEPALLAHIATL